MPFIFCGPLRAYLAPTLTAHGGTMPTRYRPNARAGPPAARARAAPYPMHSLARRARAPRSPSSARASPYRHARTRTRATDPPRNAHATDPPRRLAHNALAYGYPPPTTATHRPTIAPTARARRAHGNAAARDEMQHESLWSPYWPPSTLPVDTGGGGGPGAPATGARLGPPTRDDLAAKFKISQRIYTDIFPPPTVVP